MRLRTLWVFCLVLFLGFQTKASVASSLTGPTKNNTGTFSLTHGRISALHTWWVPLKEFKKRRVHAPN